jgi:hypothetical protein
MNQEFRRAFRALAIAAAAIAVLGRPAAGQSLAEIAKKEEERRKAVKSSAPAKPAKDDKDKTQKTLTNKDLVPTEPGTPPPPPPAQAAQPAESQAPSHAHVGGEEKGHAAAPKAPGAAQAPAAQDAGAAGDEKYWRGRMVTARGNLQRQELFLEALQSRVNALTTDFVNRDDPAQRAQIAADRQKALAEMESVRKDIEQAKKQIADLEEEARKAGVPPGWLR